MEKNLMVALNELVTDTRFRKLAVTQNFENFFNVNGINESENAYVLSWFLNPKGSHGLKDLFFKEFITSAWSTIHGSTKPEYKAFKTWGFYNHISPLAIQQASYQETYLDKEVKAEFKGADFVITDYAQKLMVVVNNRFNKTECEKAYKHFSGKEFSFFENKLFISFDTEVQSHETSTWMYMGNEWMINLCATLIEQGEQTPVYRYVCDLYQFLTGTTYGAAAEQTREYSASIVSAYYQTFVDLMNYKSERIPAKALITVNPREYATLTQGTFAKMDQEILSLYWSYRNTFNTFFQLVELETCSRTLNKMVEKKSYACEKTFIRNGLSFSPKFTQLTFGQEIINQIFDVELVQDWNKNFCMTLVVNKSFWDKLSLTQKAAIQKNFDWTGTLAQERTTIWSQYYKWDQKGYDFSKEIVNMFDRVEGYVKSTFAKVA